MIIRARTQSRHIIAGRIEAPELEAALRRSPVKVPDGSALRMFIRASEGRVWIDEDTPIEFEWSWEDSDESKEVSGVPFDIGAAGGPVAPRDPAEQREP